MTGPPPLEFGSASRRRGRLGHFAPLPLVGTALLLVVLIVLTPALESNSHQPGPGLLTQAELVVDKIASNATMHFYIWALGETIRYAQIDVGVATGFNWTGTQALNWSALNFSAWTNQTDTLSVSLASSANPLALSVFVHYASPAGATWYVAMLAFYVGLTSPPSGESLYASSPTSGVAVDSSIAVSNDTLPEAILLANAGPGGGP